VADNLCSIVPSSAGASEQAIQAHYDVSNDFYALWLDSSMVYSCALWDDEDAGDTLHLAQLRKLDYHLSEAQAHGKARLLDVGSGWGALLERSVTHYGVGHAVGLTLSRAQADWVAQSASERVSVLLESWADHAPEASYDAIVSIGAFEHFAKIGLAKAQKIDAYRRFFKWCHEHASDNCTLSLQSIVTKTTTNKIRIRLSRRYFRNLSFRACRKSWLRARACLKSPGCAMIDTTTQERCRYGTRTCASTATRRLHRSAKRFTGSTKSIWAYLSWDFTRERSISLA
jgi:cyclopropane fatty-acyl-phospholipid synthase-like methyltransferase